MRWVVLGLALLHPDPIWDLEAHRNHDGTVTLTWLLPSDPSIVGITIERERLDGYYDWDVFEIDGPASSFLDSTAHDDRSYRYWVYTRDASGDPSPSEWVEVWSDDDYYPYWDGHCEASASSGEAGPVFLLGLFLAAAFALRRRGA